MMILNKLKFLTQVILPVLGTLYFALAGVLDLPFSEKVVFVYFIVDAFLGVLLYNIQNGTDGVIEVIQSASGKKTYSLNLNGDPEDIDTRDEVVFKVTKA